MVRSSARYLGGAELKQLQKVAQLTLEKELETTVNHRSNTFSTGIGMADILAHLHVDEDTLSAAVLYRSVREGLITLEDIQQQFGEQVLSLVKGTLAMGKLSELIEKINV
jgi:GTP pyrophosphokinase